MQSPAALSNFNVQRSEDADHWQNIGELNTSNTYTQYTYTDQNPMSGINYYRIGLVSKNRVVEYSGIMSIMWQTYNDITVYPNPAGSYINISTLKNIHSIVIKNIEGQNIEFIQINNCYNNINLNISRLMAGIYFVQIDNAVYKLIKNKIN